MNIFENHSHCRIFLWYEKKNLNTTCNYYAMKLVVSMKVEAHISRSLSIINGIVAAVTFEVFFILFRKTKTEYMHNSHRKLLVNLLWCFIFVCFVTCFQLSTNILFMDSYSRCIQTCPNVWYIFHFYLFVPLTHVCEIYCCETAQGPHL